MYDQERAQSLQQRVWQSVSRVLAPIPALPAPQHRLLAQAKIWQLLRTQGQVSEILYRVTFNCFCQIIELLSSSLFPTVLFLESQ